MRISDWSSDVCSSYLLRDVHFLGAAPELDAQQPGKTVLQLFDRQALSFDGLLCCPQFGPLQLHDLSSLPQHCLQETGVCREAIKVEPHDPDYRTSGIYRLHNQAFFQGFIAQDRKEVVS